MSGIGVGARALTLLFLNKILAIYVGPAGFAVMGQFQNAVAVVLSLASGAVNNGVIKYTAEYRDDEERQRDVWRTAGSIAAICSLVLASGIAIFHRPLAHIFLKTNQYQD